ncbi:MAG: hypothetical protein AAB400_01110 [Patescibacteria group bacterium]
MKLTRLLCLAFVSMLFSFLFATQALALRIAPTVVELSTLPGEPVAGFFQVVNNEQSPLTLTPTIYEAVPSVSDEKGFASIVAPTQNSTLANWIKLDETILLQPGEKKDIRFIVTVPQNAPPGGHYAAISLSQPATTPSGSGAAIVPQLTVNVALDIAGESIEKADIVSFKTESGKTNFDKLPVKFFARLHNGGNRHFRPTGAVVIKNMFGSTVAELPIKTQDAGGNILPGSTRQYDFDWVGEFAFGKYTAMFSADLGGAGTKAASIELWVMPAGLLVLWLIIALIIIVILVLLIKRAVSSSSALKK